MDNSYTNCLLASIFCVMGDRIWSVGEDGLKGHEVRYPMQLMCLLPLYTMKRMTGIFLIKKRIGSWFLHLCLYNSNREWIPVIPGWYTGGVPDFDISSLEMLPPQLNQEVDDLYASCPLLKYQYKITDKIGEGTFSSVYKALDIETNERIQQNPSSFSKFILNSNLDQGQSKKLAFVALKRIYVTSSPARILAELNVLSQMRHPNVIPLLSAFRQNDQVIAVLPYFHHEDFRCYYTTMDVDMIRIYMKQLVASVQYIQGYGILHRDIKPSNFLFDPKIQRGVLVDFGLAQFESSMVGKEVRKVPRRVPLKLFKQPGVYVKDPRPSVRANRAGTRGFRAPEILFKVVQQTGAIDMWSVGVILLSILTKKYPFFNSNDDGESIAEIAHIFGLREMQRLARRFDRIFDTNLPTIQDGIPFEMIIKQLAPENIPLANEFGMHILRNLLALHPTERWTAEQVLNELN